MLMLGITILMISLNTFANSEPLLKDSIGDNNFTQRFLPHDPMYFSFGVGKPPYPEFRYYFSKSWLNSDIENYWGYSTLELIWSSNIGIQLHTWFVPAKIESSFQTQLTFSMNKIWKPLNLYLFTAYHSGFGETIIDYDKYSKGYLLGIALIR